MRIREDSNRFEIMRKTFGRQSIRSTFPPDDAPQDDPTGAAICITHLAAMRDADEVHVFWDVESYGSHFDLGMAYALKKRIVPVSCERIDKPRKSYWKAVINR